MNEELYLIAHKVRGEPAFDVAIKMHVDTLNEDFWIIPTSGHRAYPYWFIPLNDLAERYDPICGFNQPSMPEDTIDHYNTTAAPKGFGTKTFEHLLGLIGLEKKDKITRRF